MGQSTKYFYCAACAEMETVGRRTCAIEYNNTFRDRVMCFIPGNGNSLFGTVNPKKHQRELSTRYLNY